MNWFKQAVTGPDNRTFEGAYLALAFMVVLAGLSVISMLALSGLDLFVNKREFNPAGLGGGISAVLGGLAAFLGGVGAYILMDRKGPTAPTTTTTETQSTVVKTVAPLAAPLADIESAGRGIEAMPSKIGPEDVGARPMLSKSKPTKRRRK